MDLEKMLSIQNLSDSNNLSSAGSAVGGLIGSFVGQPILGSAIGSVAGTFATALIPSFSHVHGSVSGVNFVTLNLKPYQISLIEPDIDTAKNISDYYCYYGCKTTRSEPLNISNYLYNNHAYVRGELQYNSTIPLDKFNEIKKIFSNGTHILNE